MRVRADRRFLGLRADDLAPSARVTRGRVDRRSATGNLDLLPGSCLRRCAPCPKPCTPLWHSHDRLAAAIASRAAGHRPVVMVVVGSGIAAQQLSSGQAGPSHARRCDKLSRSCRMVPARRRRDGLTSVPSRSPAARRSPAPCRRRSAGAGVLGFQLLGPLGVIGLHPAELCPRVHWHPVMGGVRDLHVPGHLDALG